MKPKFFWLNIHLLKKKKHRWKEREIWRNHIEKVKIWEEFTIKKTPNCEHELCWKKKDDLKNIIHRADRADLVHLKYLNSI